MRTILMSIKAEHNANIEFGRKTLEMRKRIPRCALPIRVLTYESGKNGRHMVTNEWVCDYIREEREVANGLVDIILEEESCVQAKDLIEYADGDILYSMHISELKVYKTPKKLSSLVKPCPFGEDSACTLCEKSGYAPDMHLQCYNTFTRPPQSWCYVETEI